MNQDSQKVKVSTEYNTLRQRLLKYIDVEVLDNEDENYTDEQSSEFENEQYSNFVYKVKHVDTNQQWIVFDDNYTSGPISTLLMVGTLLSSLIGINSLKILVK